MRQKRKLDAKAGPVPKRASLKSAARLVRAHKKTQETLGFLCFIKNGARGRD